MMSHYSSSHNVLFKITVPKRTGRKRKRGSDEPWQGNADEPSHTENQPPSESLRSKAKLDEAKILRRKLQDNIGRYEAEAVGIIKHTHRYRGMLDFNVSMKNNGFMNKFTDTFLTGDGKFRIFMCTTRLLAYSLATVTKFRQFSLKSGTDTTPNQEIIAPPLMTQVTVPYYYHYSQNPYVRAVATGDGDIEMVNTTSRVQSVGYFIGIRDPVPTAPTGRPSVRDPLFDHVVTAMRMCMEERPVWTRRSIINRLVDISYDPKHPERRLPRNLSQQIVKNSIQFAGYQFKGGPWRDALVKYGYDPRTDRNARIYQCLIFRLRRLEVGQMGTMWQEIRKNDLAGTKFTVDEHADSHMFDGKTYRDDGKVWQVCDITDPILSKLLTDAPYRPVCDIEGSGWYHRGLWAKARAIMKCKMRAIQFGRELKDSDFDAALRTRDDTPDLETTKSIAIPTPDLKLTDAEWELVRGKRYKGVGRQRKNKRSSYHFPGKRTLKKLRVAAEGEPLESQEGDGGDTAAEDGEEEGILETVEGETGLMDVLPSDYEDGSEYDEDDGDEDEEDFEEQDYGENDEDLAEQLRLEQYNYTDAEQGNDEEEEEEEDEQEAGEGEGNK